MNLRRRFLWVTCALAVVGAAAWFLTPLPSPLFLPCGVEVRDTEDRLVHAFLAPDEQWRFTMEEDALPHKFEATVVAFEDKRFYSHFGVDVLALARATWQNLRAGKVRSGASTLTMQVARLSSPKKRTLWNKLLEMAHAFKLERRHGKEDILRLYLTHAPYGGNIVGVSAAAYHFYGRPPSRLTWAEAATLAVLPKAPGQITPWKNSETLLARRNALLRRLHGQGAFDDGVLEHAMREPLPVASRRMPQSAPHFARLVSGRRKGPVLRTTLDRDLQAQAEFVARRHASMLARGGIHGASVLVADARSGAVRAYVGSPDFLDTEHAGQVDGIRAPRSTGSILKPFLYALLMDRGALLPETMVRDVPISFSGYAPVNAEGWFHGMVPAREALTRSLNVPPVLMLREYGTVEFWHFLREAGMTTLFREPSQYGLTLILGGAEGTLWDIASLYRGLAGGGSFSGLKIFKDEPIPPGKPLLSEAASWLTLDILTETNRPDDDGVDITVFPSRRRVAWKTGTSFGRRDAWAVGVTPEWVVAVWVGNFSGEGNRSLGGARSAAPLMFDVLDILPHNANLPWFEEPWMDFQNVSLCEDTGFRAEEHCPRVKDTASPRRASPLAACPYHRLYHLDKRGRAEVCSLCWGDSKRVRREARLVYPPDVSQLMRREGHILDSPPAHNRACPALGSRRPVEILYPSHRASLFVPRDVDGAYQKVTLRAAHNAKDSRLFWYLNGSFEGETREDHARAVVLPAGNHVLQVVDQDGYAARTAFSVVRR